MEYDALISVPMRVRCKSAVLEDDGENAKCGKENTENDGCHKEEFFEAALRVERLHAFSAAQSTADAGSRGLHEDDCDEEY